MQSMYITERFLSQLTDKLANALAFIPKRYRPCLTAEEVVTMAPELTLKAVPSDLQLDCFVRKLPALQAQGLEANKSDNQSMELTRLLFYYRIDRFHNFGVYSKEATNNFFVMNVFLRKHPLHLQNVHNVDMRERMTFMISYQEAFLEGLNNPGTFSYRERFIRLWKTSRHDLLTFTRSDGSFIARRKKKLFIALKESNFSKQDIERVAEDPRDLAAMKAVLYLLELAVKSEEQAQSGLATGGQPAINDSSSNMAYILPETLPGVDDNPLLKALEDSGGDNGGDMLVELPNTVDLRKPRNERWTLMSSEEFDALWQEDCVGELSNALANMSLPVG